MNDESYVIRSSDGCYLDGFRDGLTPVWNTNLQSIDPYCKLVFAERDIVAARSPQRWGSDPDAAIYAVSISDTGYLRISGRVA